MVELLVGRSCEEVEAGFFKNGTVRKNYIEVFSTTELSQRGKNACISSIIISVCSTASLKCYWKCIFSFTTEPVLRNELN